MIEAEAYTIASVFIVSMLSFIGILTLMINDKILKKILVFLISFSAGALFGDVFYHILPEISEKAGFTTTIATSTLTGIITFFILEKFLHWHHSHTAQGRNHTHDEECIQPYAKMNIVGDGLHNLIDGVIIAGSYMASIPLGIATTIAVILHEIPQEFGDFGVLLHGGYTKKKALALNFLSALTALLGAIITLSIGIREEQLTTIIIPFTAGGFLYIAGSDLLPELQKEKEIIKTIIQFIAIIAGIVVMRALLFIE